MKRVMRQVFGSSRPKDIWLDMLTFDRLNTRALIHMVYWAGLGLLIIAAFGVLGVAIGNALSDGSPMAYLLSLPLLVVGWLAILIGIMIWRVVCDFILSVMGIAEDLRVLRRLQEGQGGLPFPTHADITPEASPVAVADDVAAAAPEISEVSAGAAPKPDKFADVAVTLPKDAMLQADEIDPMAPAGAGNILENPFFRPRFEKPEA